MKRRNLTILGVAALTILALGGCASHHYSPTDAIAASYASDPGFEFQQPVAYLGAGDQMGAAVFEGYLAHVYQQRHDAIASGQSDAPAN